MAIYREHVLPRLVNFMCAMPTGDPHRARVCGGLSGDVGELGFGSGLNVAFYPATVRQVAANRCRSACSVGAT